LRTIGCYRQRHLSQNTADYSPLLAASKALVERDRAATILKGHAMEEVAKILILMDIVRCPPKLRGERVGPMMG